MDDRTFCEDCFRKSKCSVKLENCFFWKEHQKKLEEKLREETEVKKEK